MRGVKCSWVEMQRRRQQIEAASTQNDVKDLRCVTQPCISEWQSAFHITDILKERNIGYPIFEHFTPSHAVAVCRHYRKLEGKPKDWTDDLKDEIVQVVENCEEHKLTVKDLRAELNKQVPNVPFELWEATDKLRSALGRIAKKWPEDKLAVMADQLAAWSKEVQRLREDQ